MLSRLVSRDVARAGGSRAPTVAAAAAAATTHTFARPLHALAAHAHTALALARGTSLHEARSCAVVAVPALRACPVACASSSSKKGRQGAASAAAPDAGRAGASKSAGADVKRSGGGHSGGSGSSGSGRAGGGVEGDIICNVRELGKTLPGGRVLFQNVSLAFQRGAKIGVLGLNGAGKSSLLKILAGVDTEFDGNLWVADGVRVGYLQQEPQLDASRNVHDNIMDGLKEKTDLLVRFEELSMAMGEPDANIEELLAEQATVQAQIDHFDCWNLTHMVNSAKQALRVPPDDADVTKLSGGEKRRVALCRLLLEQPDVLLLDEPTNHLDATSVAWLEQFLQSYKGTVLAITHDRYFLDNVAGWILEIDRGAAYPYQGNYSVWLEKKATRLDLEKKHERKQAKAMEEELQWIRQGARGRQAKSKARVAAYEKLVENVETSRASSRFMSGSIVIPPAPRLGDVVLEVKGVTKHFGSRTLLRDVTFSLPKGAIVGIIGGNGTGKTTLLKILTGELEPDEGSVRMGPTVSVAKISQGREELIENLRVIDLIANGSDTVSIGTFDMPVRQYLASFNIVGELQTQLIKNLSGGQRNRVHLARVLKEPSNLLMLDEPTNDLDVDTLRSLEEALEQYTGCALIVSHDRYFIDRMATHMLIFQPHGRVTWFEGNYSDYEAYLLKNPGVAV